MHYGVVERRRRAGAPRRRPAAGSAAAARHGVHRELRDPQRLSAVLGSRAARARPPSAALPPRHAVPLRGHPAPRRTPRRSGGSRPTPPTCCTSPTPTRTATRSCSTASSRAIPNPPTTVIGDQVAAVVPVPGAGPDADPTAPLALQPGHRRRSREEQLSDSITEFGMINAGYAGRAYRYTYAATGKPGWFLFDGLVRHDLADRHRGTLRLRRRRLRQRDGDGAPRRAAPPRTTATW